VSASAIHPTTQPAPPQSPPHKRLSQYAWVVLLYNILVILWGAVVRATGSGAGCGDHWPLCNGVVLPVKPRIHTIIEFTHRMMSGLTLILVIVLISWVLARTVKHHLARIAAIAALLLTLNEAILGALLVKLGLTADSTSPWRPPMLALHLANTLILLAALALTAHFLGRREGYLRGDVEARHTGLALLGLISTIVVGVSGSLAALGDTLFPSTSLRAALEQDFSSSAQWLVRLRIIHPVSAVIAAVFVLWLVRESVLRSSRRGDRRLAWTLIGLIAVQFALGSLDVVMRAPVWLQVIHLAGADALWTVLVVLAARVSIVPRLARME
jgi:cytochrome c oxidase assembly protein subunit 15